MSLILTWINIAGGTIALFRLVTIFKTYSMPARTAFYIYLTIVSTVIFLFTQFYIISIPPMNWKLKLVGVYWWGKTLYFAWWIRFNLLKK